MGLNSGAFGQRLEDTVKKPPSLALERVVWGLGLLPDFRREQTQPGAPGWLSGTKEAHMGQVERRWPAEGSGLLSLPAGIHAWSHVLATL